MDLLTGYNIVKFVSIDLKASEIINLYVDEQTVILIIVIVTFNQLYWSFANVFLLSATLFLTIVILLLLLLF